MVTVLVWASSLLLLAFSTPRTIFADGWHQHARDAQRTSYAPTYPSMPWRWKWSFQGPTATGAVSRGKRVVPRNTQPVVGGGKVFVALGQRGIWALDQATGQKVWRRRLPGGAFSTPAFDEWSGVLYALSGAGRVYRLAANSGRPLTRVSLGGTRTTVPLPPALLEDRIILSWGSRVIALRKDDLSVLWSYDAGSTVETPPAYSVVRNVAVVVTQDLFVHAIDNASGTARWRVKPIPREGGDPGGSDDTLAEARFGWPVIAEQHGYVLVKYRLDWQALWVWSPWPPDNETMRNNLSARPEYRALFALDLDDGSVPFSPNVGHGGFGDGDYLPMGPQPVIRPLPGGGEVAYVVMRGSPCATGVFCDGRADSHLGEMVLDDDTVPGYQAGDVRFVQGTFLPTDEQPNLSAAGDALFGAHWAVGIAHRILDRTPSRGSGENPITTENLPHIAVADAHASFTPDHWYSDYTCSEACGRTFPPGFFIYHVEAPVWDRYWSEWATWVISDPLILFLSTDGALVALESAPGGRTMQPKRHLPTVAATAEGRRNLATENPSCPPLYASVDPMKARSLSGCAVSMEGCIQSRANNGKAIYFSFAPSRRGHLNVIVPANTWALFPVEPQRLFPTGLRVRVRGKIEWYQGAPALFVTSSDQVSTGAHHCP